MYPQSPGVLICDESALIRALVCELLEADGYVRIAEAADVDDALDQMVSAPVDVLVLDLGLRGDAGLAAIRRIRQRWPEIAIVAYAREHSARIEALAQAAGADAYVELTAPFRLASGLRSAFWRRAALQRSAA